MGVGKEERRATVGALSNRGAPLSSSSQPDATARFMEARAAFRELTEPGARRAGGPSASSSSAGFGGWGERAGAGPSSSSSSARRPAPGDPFYGFSEFFKDLEDDLSSRAAKRRQAKAGGGTPGAPPADDSAPRSVAVNA